MRFNPKKLSISGYERVCVILTFLWTKFLWKIQMLTCPLISIKWPYSRKKIVIKQKKKINLTIFRYNICNFLILLTYELSIYLQKSNSTIKTCSNFQEHEKKGVKVAYTCTHRHSQVQTTNITSGVVSASHHKLPPTIKPVDEDLYEIPSEILHNSKRVSVSSLPNSKSCIQYA